WSRRRHDREWFVWFCFGDEQITASRNGYHDDSKNDPQTLRCAGCLGFLSRLEHTPPSLSPGSPCRTCSPQVAGKQLEPFCKRKWRSRQRASPALGREPP